MTITPREVQLLLEDATRGPWYWRNTSHEVHLFGAKTRVVMGFARMGLYGAQPLFFNHDTLLLEPAGKANLNSYPEARLIARAPEIAEAYVEMARTRP